jgi:ATP-binding cassette subfamily B protein
MSLKENQSLYKILKSLWAILSQRRHRQFYLLIPLIAAASIGEMISIGAIIPFLGVLVNAEVVFQLSQIQPFLRLFGIIDSNQLIVFIGLIFILTTFLAGALRLLMLWSFIRFANVVGSDLGSAIYRQTLYLPYSRHASLNSSQVINGITNDSAVVTDVITSFLLLLSSSIILLLVTTIFLYINPIAFIYVFGLLIFIYTIIVLTTKKILKKNSEVISHESIGVIKFLQEGLGGIRDIIIDGTQEVYCRIYSQSYRRLRNAEGINLFTFSCPRYFMEAIGISIIGILAVKMSMQSDNIVSAIPLLGAMALAAQRLLPLLQSAFASWAKIKGSNRHILNVLGLLNQPILSSSSINSIISRASFDQNIRLENLGFKYPNQQNWVFRNVDISIAKGSCVGFVGTTGSGKSTMLDIIMGLLEVTEGCFAIDGRKIDLENCRTWQARIAHVPQNIFLADATIEENIAFGVPANLINSERVRWAAQQAQLAELIESWDREYKVTVGERGIRLSGGQRQRIGIARALYKDADVIILDEATSALDNKTEEMVMSAIRNLGKDVTLLISAHRVSTLSSCNVIFQLENQSINEVGTYDEYCSLLENVKRLH